MLTVVFLLGDDLVCRSVRANLVDGVVDDGNVGFDLLISVLLELGRERETEERNGVLHEQ